MRKPITQSVESRTLDLLADFAADYSPEPEEVDNLLREFGYEPDEIAASILSNVDRLAWKRQSAPPSRSLVSISRPSSMNRHALIAKLEGYQKSAQATINFKGAEHLSDDDLWLIIQQIEQSKTDDE